MARRFLPLLLFLLLASPAQAQISQSISAIGIGNTTIMGGSQAGTHVSYLCVVMSPVYPLFYGSLNVVPPQSSNFKVVEVAPGQYQLITATVIPTTTYSVTLIATQDSVTNTSQKFETTFTVTAVAP